MEYINDCSDRTPPVEDRPFSFPYPVVFAGRAGSRWDYKGIAFLDVDNAGHAFGRIYKITEDQYREVMHQEGAAYQRKVELGEIDGMPVVSFTWTHEHNKALPSIKYLDVILKGLTDTYPDEWECTLAADLINSIFSPEEIQVLDCLRKAEHHISNREIITRTGLSADDEKRIISSLTERGIVKQDRRSSSYDREDENASFFTEEGERNLIDRILELVHEAEELKDVPAQDPLTNVIAVEGRSRQYLTTRYERVPANRQAAIRIHGLSCQVCGFNFRDHYGDLGANYIEVHHIKPLSSLQEETAVDPATDLVCLCANCHRMMHRSRDHVMTVEELKRKYQN